MTDDKIKYNSEDLKDHDATSVVIKDPRGRILMQEHVKYGFWTIPVGKVKSGQSIIDGVKEEVFEETNLVVMESKEITSKMYEYIRDGVEVKVNAHMFEISRYEGVLENKEPHKHKQQKFMAVDEITELPYLSDTTLLYLSTLGINRAPRLESILS